MPQLKIEDIGKCYTCQSRETMFCPHPSQPIKHPKEGCREWIKLTDEKYYLDFLTRKERDKKNGYSI
jgi:hypothetical protein